MRENWRWSRSRRVLASTPSDCFSRNLPLLPPARPRLQPPQALQEKLTLACLHQGNLDSCFNPDASQGRQASLKALLQEPMLQGRTGIGEVLGCDTGF